MGLNAEPFNPRWLIVRNPVLWWRRLVYRWTQVPAGDGSPTYSAELGGDFVNEPGRMP